MNDSPNFKTWSEQDLYLWAQKMHDLTRKQAEIIEQLRLDNKDLSKINRELLKGNQDDWK